jgi:Bacterial Ig-like domain
VPADTATGSDHGSDSSHTGSEAADSGHAGADTAHPQAPDTPSDPSPDPLLTLQVARGKGGILASGSPLTVTLLHPDGTPLSGPHILSQDGSLRLPLKGFDGPLMVLVNTADISSSDHQDSQPPGDPSATAGSERLMALVTIPPHQDLTVAVTPLTTLAAMLVESTAPTADDITRAQQAVADRFGLQDLLQPPALLQDAQGRPSDAPDLHGRVLALLEATADLADLTPAQLLDVLREAWPQAGQAASPAAWDRATALLLDGLESCASSCMDGPAAEVLAREWTDHAVYLGSQRQSDVNSLQSFTLTLTGNFRAGDRVVFHQNGVTRDDLTVTVLQDTSHLEVPVAGHSLGQGDGLRLWTADIQRGDGSLQPTSAREITYDGPPDAPAWTVHRHEVTVSGLESGAHVQWSTDGGLHWQSASGDRLALPDGVYPAGRLVVRQVDVLGQISAPTANTDVLTIDTFVLPPTLHLTGDTGKSWNDHVTQDASLQVGQLEHNATWVYSLDGGSTWQSGTGAEIPGSVFSADGAHEVLIRQTDAAGNVSAIAHFALVLDRQGDVPVLTLAHDTGVSAHDAITQDARLAVSGLEADADWEYRIDGGAWIPGIGQMIPSSAIPEGFHTVEVRQTDLAGNVSPLATIDLTVDRDIADLSLTLQHDTGSSDQDLLTQDPTLRVTGLEPGASWFYRINGGDWITGVGEEIPADAFSGTGPQTVEAQQRDVAGNTSLVARFEFLLLDSLNGSTSPVSLQLRNDTGVSDHDRQTQDATLILTGLDNTRPWFYSLDNGQTWAEGQGQTIDASAFPADGMYEVVVRQADIGGHDIDTLPFLLHLDTQAGPAPTLTLVNDTGTSATDHLTADATLSVGGLEAGAHWDYRINAGAWVTGHGREINDAVMPADGPVRVEVRQTDAAGNISSISEFNLHRDTVAVPVTLALAHDTGLSDSDLVTRDGTVLVMGLEAGAQWEYRLNGSAWRPGTGSTINDTLLSEGAVAIEVRQTDAAGNISAVESIHFERISQMPAPTLALTEDTGASAHDAITRNGTVSVGGLMPGATWHYSMDDGQTWSEGQGSELDHSVFPASGDFTLRVVQTDAAGNISEPGVLTFTLLLDAPIMDLDAAAGVQDSRTTTLGIAATQQGTALTATTGGLTHEELHTLFVRLDSGLDAQDEVSLDRTLRLDRDLTGTQATLAGVTGLDYQFDLARGLLTIRKSDGSGLTGLEASALTNALRFRNGSPIPPAGERVFSIYGQDMAGNVGAPATVRITVDNRVPLLDLNGRVDGVDELSFVNSLQAPVRLFATDLQVTHTNPQARFERVTLVGNGGGISLQDQLTSESPNGHTVLVDGGVVQVGEVWWTVTLTSTRYTLSRSDGTAATPQDVQQLLASLHLQNLEAFPIQGERRFTVMLTDQVGNNGRAIGQVLLDQTAPVADLNGQAAGLDHTTYTVAGIAWMLPVFNPATARLLDASPITQLVVEFSSSLADAFNTAPGRQERIGLADEDDSDGIINALVLGLGGVLIDRTLVAGRTITLQLSDSATRPTLVITADTPLTDAEVSLLLQRLRYEGDANVLPGLRQVAVTASDLAGNTITRASVSELSVMPVGTPYLFLANDTDTGSYRNDGVTQRDGSDNAPLRLRGAANPGATLAIHLDLNRDGVPDNAELLGTVVCDANGRWDFQLPTMTLADGVHQFLALDTTTRQVSPPLSITVDTRPPASSFGLGDSVALSPVLSGVSDADERVLVDIDTDGDLSNGYELRYETWSDASGQWRVDTAVDWPAVGEFRPFLHGDTVHARVTTFDIAGNATVREDSSTAIASVFNLSDAHVVEGNTGTRELVFMVSRSGDLQSDGSVGWSLDLTRSSARSDANGLASDSDFSGAVSGRVAFAPGESEKLVRFTVSGDYYREVNERLLVNLEEPRGGQIGDGLGIGTLYEIDVGLMQATYSMRNLNPNLNTAAIRVRRSSDHQEQDIGFDANGNLDTTALLNFVGRGSTDTGFVTTWYDQSGHERDMTQTDPDKQGVIVDGGTLVTRADGSPGISFNTRNGAANDFMVANGVAGTTWTSALLYSKVQSEGSRNGSLFNLGVETSGRLSAHYPEANRGYVFDVNNQSVGRLSRPVSNGNSALLGMANDIVFEAHSGNKSAGTAERNFTDSAQAIYENGINVASDATLSASFPTSAQWQLARHSTTSSYYQQVIYNEFMVYLATDNSAPDLQSLLGTANNDVLTYSGESTIRRIDGMAGHDTLYLSGTVDLNFAQMSGGVKGIGQVWMDNGQANTLTLDATTLAANGSGPLTVVMGEGDAVVLNGERIAYNAQRQQSVGLGQHGDDVLFSTAHNDVMLGGGGADTFTWRDNQRGVDTVQDFSDAQGDRLDLSALLRRMTAGDTDLYLLKQVDGNAQVSVLVDQDGQGHFRDAELTILLGSAHATDPITIVTQYGTTTL